jgi:hypothetical protein
MFATRDSVKSNYLRAKTIFSCAAAQRNFFAGNGFLTTGEYSVKSAGFRYCSAGNCSLLGETATGVFAIIGIEPFALRLETGSPFSPRNAEWFRVGLLQVGRENEAYHPQE